MNRPGTRLAGVIGHPIEHSRSPALHNAAYRARGLDAIYAAFDVVPDQLAAALSGARALGFMGLNVTVPHKRAALERCDDVDEDGALVGAVNTVLIEDGRLRGANTDVEGFGISLDEGLAGRKVRRAVVLGAGGAARAVVVAVARRGIPCAVVARDVERARGLLPLGASDAAPWSEAALAKLLDGADLLIDASSAGLHPETELQLPAAIPLDAMDGAGLVVSLVYHRETALLAEASARRLQTLDGASMLIYQAARAFRLMTGHDAPLDAMWAAFGQDIARTPET